MAVPTGTASLLDIQNEFGGSNPISLSEYYGKGPAPSSGTISINTFRGASNVFTLTISSHTANLNVSSAATAAGWNGSAALNVVLNSGIYVYATSTSTAAMIINVAGTTLTNSGKIIGRGGNGGLSHGAWGAAGGPAINVTVSGVTITNNSGAYIAGGGGGGGSRNNVGGGGSGAGQRFGESYYADKAGGGGGGIYRDNTANGWPGGWGLPGVGTRFNDNGFTRGGSGGSPGVTPSGNNWSSSGGGWGASGGDSRSGGGGGPGAGGAAITGTSRTLNNSGTVYGST